VGGVHQCAQVGQGPEFGVYGAVVAHGVGRIDPAQLAHGVNGHQVQYVHPQVLNRIEPGRNARKIAGLAEGPHVYLVHHRVLAVGHPGEGGAVLRGRGRDRGGGGRDGDRNGWRLFFAPDQQAAGQQQRQAMVEYTTAEGHGTKIDGEAKTDAPRAQRYFLRGLKLTAAPPPGARRSVRTDLLPTTRLVMR